MRVTSKDIHHLDVPPAHVGQNLILITVALLLIALIDHATGDLPFHHLYYLPIIFSATRFGRRGSLIVSLASVVLYHLTNPRLLHLQQNEGDIFQVILFFSVGIIAAKLTDNANRMRLLAITDDLTGLHNLRSFEAQIAALINQARIDKTPLSLLVLDLDRLKSLNENFGHLAGADAVRTVGQLIARHIPPNAVACRYGGDEFVIALPAQTIEQATKLAEVLRQAVYDAQPTLVGRPFPEGTLSISVGVAGRRGYGTGETTHESEGLFQAADRALYIAKKQGRNKVWATGTATKPDTLQE